MELKCLEVSKVLRIAELSHTITSGIHTHTHTHTQTHTNKHTHTNTHTHTASSA
jgi:hypothetical protein